MEKKQRNNVPMRMCIVCRQSRSKNELIRIVHTPEGQTVLDRTGRLNGRGTYVCSDGECVKKALEASKISNTIKEVLKDNG